MNLAGAAPQYNDQHWDRRCWPKLEHLSLEDPGKTSLDGNITMCCRAEDGSLPHESNLAGGKRKRLSRDITRTRSAHAASGSLQQQPRDTLGFATPPGTGIRWGCTAGAC